MSATLYCYPYNIPKGIELSDDLKYRLGRKYCDTDGTIGYDTVLNNSNVEYLEGLRDAGVKDADILLVNYNVARQKTTLCGTAMEILLAHQLGKFVVVFTDLPKEEWSPWMIYHSTRIFKSFGESLEYLKTHY